MKVTWYISWKKIIDFGFTGVETLQTICLVDLKSFVFKKKLKFFKELNMSGISGFSFWAIERIRKEGNGVIFRRPHFSGKRIREMLFHKSELILQLQTSKSCIWIEISLAMKVKTLYQLITSIQIIKTIVRIN